MYINHVDQIKQQNKPMKINNKQNTQQNTKQSTKQSTKQTNLFSVPNWFQNALEQITFFLNTGNFIEIQQYGIFYQIHQKQIDKKSVDQLRNNVKNELKTLKNDDQEKQKLKILLAFINKVNNINDNQFKDVYSNHQCKDLINDLQDEKESQCYEMLLQKDLNIFQQHIFFCNYFKFNQVIDIQSNISSKEQFLSNEDLLSKIVQDQIQSIKQQVSKQQDYLNACFNNSIQQFRQNGKQGGINLTQMELIKTIFKILFTDIEKSVEVQYNTMISGGKTVSFSFMCFLIISMLNELNQIEDYGIQQHFYEQTLTLQKNLKYLKILFVSDYQHVDVQENLKKISSKYQFFDQINEKNDVIQLLDTKQIIEYKMEKDSVYLVFLDDIREDLLQEIKQRIKEYKHISIYSGYKQKENTIQNTAFVVKHLIFNTVQFVFYEKSQYLNIFKWINSNEELMILLKNLMNDGVFFIQIFNDESLKRLSYYFDVKLDFQTNFQNYCIQMLQKMMDITDIQIKNNITENQIYSTLQNMTYQYIEKEKMIGVKTIIFTDLSLQDLLETKKVNFTEEQSNIKLNKKLKKVRKMLKNQIETQKIINAIKNRQHEVLQWKKEIQRTMNDIQDRVAKGGSSLKKKIDELNIIMKSQYEKLEEIKYEYEGNIPKNLHEFYLYILDQEISEEKKDIYILLAVNKICIFNKQCQEELKDYKKTFDMYFPMFNFVITDEQSGTGLDKKIDKILFDENFDRDIYLLMQIIGRSGRGKVFQPQIYFNDKISQKIREFLMK